MNEGTYIKFPFYIRVLSLMNSVSFLFIDCRLMKSYELNLEPRDDEWRCIGETSFSHFFSPQTSSPSRSKRGRERGSNECIFKEAFKEPKYSR